MEETRPHPSGISPEAGQRGVDARVASQLVTAGLRRELTNNICRDTLADYGFKNREELGKQPLQVRQDFVIDLVAKGMQPSRIHNHLCLPIYAWLKDETFSGRLLKTLKQRQLGPAVTSLKFLSKVVEGKVVEAKPGLRRRCARDILEVTGILGDSTIGVGAPLVRSQNTQINIYGDLTDEQLRQLASRFVGLDPSRLPAGTLAVDGGTGAAPAGAAAPLAPAGSGGAKAARVPSGPAPA